MAEALPVEIVKTDKPRPWLFKPGNKGGPGSNGRLGKYRAAFAQAVTPEDLEQVVRSMVQAAIAGDVQAGTVILAYCLGKPKAEGLAETDREAGQNLQKGLMLLAAMIRGDRAKADELCQEIKGMADGGRQ